MIEFTNEQEGAGLRRDCRSWTELMSQEWYSSDVPGALDYPPVELIQHLRAVYFSCVDANIDDIEYISRLGFNVLRANTLHCESADIIVMVNFFLQHAKEDNIEYAQTWINFYLEED